MLPTGGLFVNDYTRLPSLTNDMARATADIDEFGYCIWRDAISHPERRAMARRLWAQSQAEERVGLVSDSAIKQNARFISSIINKGEEFEPLLTHPVATELLTHMLGEHFNLSTGFAKILMPGAKAETLHTDQWWSAPPQKRVLSLPPSVRVSNNARICPTYISISYPAAAGESDQPRPKKSKRSTRWPAATSAAANRSLR